MCVTYAVIAVQTNAIVDYIVHCEGLTSQMYAQIPMESDAREVYPHNSVQLEYEIIIYNAPE